MFKVTVLRMKDIVKMLMVITLMMCIIIILSKWLKRNTEKVHINTSKITNIDMTKCLEQTIPKTGDIEIKENSRTKKNMFEEILKTQIASIKQMEATIETQAEPEDIEISTEKEEEIKMAGTGLQTEVTTNNPISDNYNVQYQNVKIKNQTEYTLTDDILDPNITIEKKNIILFHTHSCESYTPSENYNYIQTGNFRTTDLNYTVTRVGTELEKQLKEYKYNVIHDTSYHDYPSYNGSYTNSLATVENILKTNNADIIIDIHRDAIGSRSDYAPIVKIGETDEAAQLMFVVGTDNGGLWHPNWQENLKFAIKVQQKAEEMYPGLFKSILLTKSRYNQHTGKYASIIEVGATGNTMEQCLTSMKYLAKIMDEILK